MTGIGTWRTFRYCNRETDFGSNADIDDASLTDLINKYA